MKLPLDRAKLSERIEGTSLIMILMLAVLFIGFLAELPVEDDPLTYQGLWRSVFVIFGPVVAPLPGISMSPWQILLFALLPFSLGTSAATRRYSREMDQAIFVSIGCIAVTFLWGLLRGGSAYFAYYQLWHFLAALLIAYLLMSVVRTERDLVSLGKLVVLAALLRATFCIYVYWTCIYGKVDPIPEFVTDHDDSVLWVVGILIVSFSALFKGRRRAWTLAGLAVPCMLYALVLNNRRIAWVELGLAILLTYFLLDAGPLRSRINRWVAGVAPVVLVYIIAGWGSDSAVFAPVRALSTAGSNRDVSSLTRLEEDRNLLRTLANSGNPIVGTGWGRPYGKWESTYSNYAQGWTLMLYTPHNSILGLAAFSGLLGVFGIWGVLAVGAHLAARGFRGSVEPVQQAAGMAAVGALTVYGAHCYGDIGFESFKGALILGAALATAGKIAAWSEAQRSATTTRAEVGRRALEPRFTYRKGAAPRGHERPAEGPGPPAGRDMTGKPARAPVRRPWR